MLCNVIFFLSKLQLKKKNSVNLHISSFTVQYFKKQWQEENLHF